MAARRRKLLLADDSPTIQKVVSLTFSDEGMEVTAVGSGDEALAEIGRARPDVVLADVHMPGVGGYELCERIKRDSALAGIPVVLLVGAFEPFSEAEARRVGADEVLTKPFQSIKELVGKVGSLFGGKQPAAADAPDAAGQPPATEATAAPPPQFEATAGSARDLSRDETDVRASQAAASATATEADSARSAPEPATSFSDFDMDDRMIEARPAEGVGGADSARETSSEAVMMTDDTARGALTDEANQMQMRTQEEETASEAASGAEFAAATAAPEWGGEFEPRAFEAERRGVEVEARAAEARIAEPAFTTRLASAAAADDALLDLGGVEPPPASAESDDFILDLDDETPVFSTPARPQHESAAASFPFGAHAGETTSRVDAAGAFAEAAHGAGEGASLFAESSANVQADATAPAYEELTAEVAREPYAREYEAGAGESAAPRDFIEPRVVPSDEPEHRAGAHAVEDLSVEGDIARPPLEPAQPASAQQLDAAQLPPEVIEAIARRAVELLSERVVREVAWEVVPELAERLIKQRLDEIAQK